MICITANKQKRQKCYIREGAFAYLQNVSGNYMRIIILAFAVFIITSCDSPQQPEHITVDELGYNLLSSLKNNNKKAFLELFDAAVLAQTSQGKMDTAFTFYKSAIDIYELPAFDVWKKERFAFNSDTTNHVLIMALPIIFPRDGKPDYVIELHLSPENRIIGISLNKMPDASQMPDDHFPDIQNAFNYSFDSLESIKLYYLPGINSDPKLSKYQLFGKNEFNDTVKADFNSLFSHLNASSILSSEKIVSQQPNSNDLKAVIFVYRINGRERNLFLISNNFQENSLAIDDFYVTNATRSYTINEDDRIQLTSDIAKLIDKYIAK